MQSLTRRRWLAGATLAAPWMAYAVQQRSLRDPMRLAVDETLFDSGLASRLQRAFGVDTGVAVQLIREPASRALEALERGERDSALTNAPELELKLASQGLVHSRKLIASTEFLLVGPLVLAKPLEAKRDVVLALTRLMQAQTPFVGNNDAGGSQLAEIALWRAAKILPEPPWFTPAPAGQRGWRQARAGQACAIVERGEWLHQGGGNRQYDVLVAGDPLQVGEVHLMSSFRSHHPTAKLFRDWIGGRQGRRVVPNVAGYRAPPA